MSTSPIYDIAIIGGGVNGCAIARDAAGRGLSVFLCEAGDLAQGTSSASTKLFHGGLRYLEYYDFLLVRHSLIERELLLKAMPHIARPLRFVLPYHRGLRPAWLLRLGLFIYDHLDFRPGVRKMLPGTKTLDLTRDIAGDALKQVFRKGFEYSDGWVDDARLVVLNARDAADRGAEIAVRRPCTKATRVDGSWQVTVTNRDTDERRQITARALVNAGGPWVGKILDDTLALSTSDQIRLVRGSHIVVPKLFDHDRAYIFQQGDGRIIFAIPFQEDFTLIGTTDIDHETGLDDISCTRDEAEYLCRAASEYFKAPIDPAAIVWTYSGVRPLYDDGAKSASAVTRDYVLKREGGDGEAPLINVFGGKITTHRYLASQVMRKLRPDFPRMGRDWTAGVPLPGGDFPPDQLTAQKDMLQAAFPFLDERWAWRLIRAYGTRAHDMLAGAKTAAHLGRDFGASLTERELHYLVDTEWARTADDVLWRRGKLGLRLSEGQKNDVKIFMQSIVHKGENRYASTRIHPVGQVDKDTFPIPQHEISG